MNTTISTAGNAYFNKTFYDRKLLDTAKTRFVHANFGQKRSIPRNNGKRVEFRKYDLFTPDTDALWNIIRRAEAWLNNNTYTTEIRKWDTDHWGEIPADFNRK